MRRCIFLLLCLLTPLSWSRPTLGTGAAFAPDGTLWVVRTHDEQLLAQTSSDDGQTWSAPRALLQAPEPIAADGENRPKIAFGKDGVVAISWTRPTSAHYTGDIRLLRSVDGGRHWSAPRTVHTDTQRVGHRFDAMAFDDAGRLYVLWIDKRHSESSYRGAAIYAAVSSDGGAHFEREVKLADHSCECCRIALSFDPSIKKMSAFWRHVFEPNERDFMLATFGPDLRAQLQRATQDHWAIDACPHHGGSLSVAADGTQHRVWFNVVGGVGRSFYGRETQGAIETQALPQGAEHADVIASGERVVLVWKAFDGKATQLKAWSSKDGGHHFTEHTLMQTDVASDAPHLVAHGARVFAIWTTAEKLNVIEVQP